MKQLVVLPLLLLLAGQAPGGESLTIKVNTRKQRQTIAGFGGTVGWIYPQEKKLEEVADLLFKDLGASILRMSALSKNGDATDEESPERTNDNRDPEKINWRAFDFKACELEQAKIARAAAKRGVRTFVAASWSPPGWMKTNGSRKWGGQLGKGMEKEFAELWTAYLLWMKQKQGISIAGLAIQNEPEVPRPYPTAEFTPKRLDACARALLGRAERAKLKPRLLYPEVSQLGRLEKYLKAADRWTIKASGAISVHAYDLSVDFYNVDAYRKKWRDVRKLVARYRKPLWMTEFSNYSGAFSGREQGTWKEALAWARHMHLALVEGECSAVLFWGLYFDKKGEALIYAKTSKAEKYEITPKFYTSKNYFRFVRPGAVRLECTPTGGKLEASAYWDAMGRKLTLVAINPGKKEHFAGLRISGLAEAKSTEIYRTSEKEQCVKLDLESEKVDARRLRFPPESVTTLVFSYGKGK